MERVAHGVHDGPDFRRDAVEAQHVGGGHHDVLGEGAVAVHSDDARIAADVAVAGAALQTVAAHDVALGGHQSTGLEFGDTVADGDDLPGELVAYDHRGVHAALRPGVPIGDVEVGAAHACMAHRDEHFPGAGRRLGDRLHDEPWGALRFHDRLHQDSGTGRREMGQKMDRVNPPSTWSTAPVI